MSEDPRIYLCDKKLPIAKRKECVDQEGILPNIDSLEICLDYPPNKTPGGEYA